MNRRILIVATYLILLPFLENCSKSSNPPNGNEDSMGPEQVPDPQDGPNATEDDKVYLVLRNDGDIFEIGNKSGHATLVDQINKRAEFSSIIFNAIASTPSKIYICEGENNGPVNYLHMYDPITGLAESQQLDLTNPAFGGSAVLVSLDWDSNSSKLIGIVTNNSGFPFGSSYVVQIDPDTLEVEYLGIELGTPIIISTTLIDSKLYASSVKSNLEEFDDFLEIDLSAKTMKSLNFQFPHGITQLSNNTQNDLLFGYFYANSISELPNSSEPITINSTTGEYMAVSSDTNFASTNFNAKSYFDNLNKIHASLMSTNEIVGILEYDIEVQATRLIELQNWEEIDGRKSIIFSFNR